MSIVNNDLTDRWIGHVRPDMKLRGQQRDGEPHGRSAAGYVPMMTGIIIVIALIIQACLLWQAREEAWNTALRSGENLMRTLSDSVERSLSAVELSLSNARIALENGDFEAHPSRPQGFLQFDRTTPLGLVSSVQVTSRRGDVALQVGASGTFSPNLADRDYFLAHVRRNVDTYLSVPFRDRFHGGEPSIAMSQRLSEQEGVFNGVVVASLRLSYFRALLSTVKLGPKSTVSIMETNGTMLMRWPSTDGEGNIGLDMNRLPAFERMMSSTDYFVTKGGIDGESRLYIFRQVGSFPVLLSVAIGLSDIYADWNRHALISGALTLAFCIALACFARAIQLSLARSAHMEKLLETLSLTDPLTGLPNRRAFDERFDSELRRMTREGTQIALLLIDLDHFKVINDTYGSQAGDRFLQTLARLIQRSAMRPGDMVARLDAEAFAVLMPSTDLKGALHIGERIRSDIERASISLETGLRVGTTVSIGAATAQDKTRPTPDTFFALATKALQEAKAKGRNQLAWREHSGEAAERDAQAAPDADGLEIGVPPPA